MTTSARRRLSLNAVAARILAGLTALFVVIYGAAAGYSMWANRRAELSALREPAIAPMGTLLPARADFEYADEDPMFAALRTALAARTWAQLQISCAFPEAADSLEPSVCDRIEPPSTEYVINRFREIGPPAFEPLRVSIRENGIADVTTCALAAPSFYDTVTMNPLERDELTPKITTWSLAPQEDVLAEGTDTEQTLGSEYRLRTGWGLSPDGFRTGESCQPQQPLTIQVFENWQSTPAFTYFDSPDPGASTAEAAPDRGLHVVEIRTSPSVVAASRPGSEDRGNAAGTTNPTGSHMRSAPAP